MKRYYVTVNGNRYDVEIEEVKGEFNSKVASDAESSFEKKEEVIPQSSPQSQLAVKETPNPTVVANGDKIECPMPGTILKVNISEGVSIKKGDVIFVLEAMKMENEIIAPRSGKIVQVTVEKGSVVNTGDTLAVIE